MGLHLAGEGAEAQKEGRVPRVTREGPEASSEAQGRGSAHRTTFLSRAGGWEEAAPLGRDLSSIRRAACAEAQIHGQPAPPGLRSRLQRTATPSGTNPAPVSSAVSPHLRGGARELNAGRAF